MPVPEDRHTIKLPVSSSKDQMRHRTTVTVSFVYIPGSKEIDRGELSETIRNLSKPCMLLGNFNAHNQSWGDSKQKIRGREMEHIINVSNLNVLKLGSLRTFFDQQ